MNSKILVEGSPPQSWPSRQNGTTVTVSMIIFKMCHLKIFWKSYTLNPNHLLLQEKYVAITIVEWLVSAWHINYRGKTSQTEQLFESDLRFLWQL